MKDRFFCRFITEDHSQNTAEEIKSFCLSALSKFDAEKVRFSAMKLYYKNEGQGELVCTFYAESGYESDIISEFASGWQSGVADVRFSRIFCPKTVFIWISSDK